MQPSEKKKAFLLSVSMLAALIALAFAFGRPRVDAELGAVGGAGAGATAGDVNGDSNLDIGDAIYLLSFLFQGGEPPVACAGGLRDVTSEDIVGGTITGRDVRNGSLTELELDLNSVSVESARGNLNVHLGNSRSNTDHGLVRVLDESELDRCRIGIAGSGAGFVEAVGKNRTTVALLTATEDGSAGNMSVHDEGGEAVGRFYVDSSGNGRMQLTGPPGDDQALVRILPSGSGFARMKGPEARATVLLSTSSIADHGFITVGSPDDDQEAGVYVNSSGNGIVFGDQKNFVIDHPQHEDSLLIHSSLEGPEVGVYYRGTARLEGARATIPLPDYFESLTRKGERTVHLTCKNGWSPLFVDGEVENGQFVVRTTSTGDPRQEFTWEVKAVRADVERLKVELPRAEFPRAVQPEDLEDVSYQASPVVGPVSAHPDGDVDSWGDR